MSISTRKKSNVDDLFSGKIGGKVAATVLASMLGSYSSSCKYLQEAIFNDKGCLEIAGRFCIPHSFYIESTGHFNAIEFIICFDQLHYVFFGEAVQRGLFPEMGFGSIENCRKILLSNRHNRGKIGRAHV